MLENPRKFKNSPYVLLLFVKITKFLEFSKKITIKNIFFSNFGVADIGWITGHTYVVYGPLSNGATTLLFESLPTYPDAGRYWKTVETHRLTQFYGAPTAYRTLIKFGDEFPLRYDTRCIIIIKYY